MPEYVLTGFTGRYYPATRDAHGVPLGDVQPGARRDLDEPPDMWWVPADGTPATEPEPAPEPASEPEPPAFDVAAPQPAPPAVIP